MADQRERREASTALRRRLGTALAFVWAKRRRKVVASGLHRPPVSRARTTSLHHLERSSSGYVRSLDFACVLERCSCVLAGTSSGLAGGSQRRYQGGVNRELRSPPQWKSIGYNLDPSVVVPVDVVQVEIAEAGVGGYSGPSFPANSGCCPFQRNSRVPVKPRPGHMLRDGRLVGLKCDGTDRCGLTKAVGDVGVGGVGHGRGERDRWCLIQRGWWWKFCWHMGRTATGAWPGWLG